MGSFRQSPGGVGVMPYDALGDADTGTAPWLSTALSGAYTGTLNTSAGYLPMRAALPPLAVTIDEEVAADRMALGTRGPPPLRFLSSEETNQRGYVLAEDPQLFKKMFPTVPYETGMTVERAIAIKEMQESQSVRDFYMKDRPITSFISQMAGSIPTPENFVPFLGELGAGVRAGILGTTAITALRSAGEAAIGAAAFDIVTMEGRAQLGQDTSWKAMAMDIGFSALIGAGFGTVGGLLNVPTPTRASPLTLADSPEARARANVVFNDAIGSFLVSPDNSVRLGPQSYRFIEETTASVPYQSFSYSWDGLQAENAPQVQEYAVRNILNDPVIANMLEGTTVANERGPIVVYGGSMVPMERRIHTSMDQIGVGPIENFMDQGVWFSTNPKHATGFIENLGTHPDIQNIDYPIDITKWKGRKSGTRALKINGEYFIGGVHAEALEKAVAYYGPDSDVIRNFENLPFSEMEKAFGHLDEKGFHPGETAIMDKDEALGYINETREGLNKKLEEVYSKDPAGAYNYNIIPPRIEGALLDIKKPKEISAKDYLNDNKRYKTIIEAMDAKDKDGNSLYDGLVVRNLDINGEIGDVYGTWLADNIFTMRDTSATQIQKGLAEKTASYQNASKLAQTNGYSYSQPQYRDYANIQGADYIPAVNMDVLARETDILKMREGVVKAAGGNLETGVTPLDEQFKAFQANRELTQDVLTKIEEADTLIKKAGFMEQVMRLAVGCVDG